MEHNTLNIDTSKPVMVTCATGYVAGWLVKRLLEEGITVHAPIRNPDSKDKTQYLDAIAASASGSIKYFKADLLTEGSYEEAIKGCEIVIHTASPFILNPKDAQTDLVDPALKGTKNVLDSVNKSGNVKRVVLTSSCVALYGDAKDTRSYPNETMTEEHWNSTSSLTQSPYNYSKTLAEREAWNMEGAQSQWKLVVINPSFVIGPSLNPNATSESLALIKQLGDGSFKSGAAEINMGCVDVRDVAEAHFRAAFHPNANGRNITSAENINVLEMANMLRPNYGEKYPLPKKNMPKWLIWLMAPAAGLTRQYVSDNVGHPWKANNSKIIKDLGMDFRPIKETINEFFQQMIDNKVFNKN